MTSPTVLTIGGVVGLLRLALNQTDKKTYERFIRSVLLAIGVGVGVGVHHQLDHLGDKHFDEILLEVLSPSVVGRGHAVDALVMSRELVGCPVTI